MREFGPPEQVYVETGWYDGPRSGLADIGGQPYRFESQFDESEDNYLGTFLVWPVGSEELALEIEQWLIFVAWNDKFENGAADTSTHPANKRTNEQWDRLEGILAPLRASAPVNAKKAIGDLVQLNRGCRYSATGPDYAIRWCLLGKGAET